MRKSPIRRLHTPGTSFCSFLLLLGLLGSVSVVFAPSPLEAQGRAKDEEGALFLLLPQGGQAVGLSRAMTAVSSPEAAFWNPAGLLEVAARRAILLRGEHVAGEALAFSFQNALASSGVFAVSYTLLDAGSQELTDATGTVLGTISVRGHQALLSAAGRWTPGLVGGLTLKFVHFSQGCRGQCSDAGVRASAVATDLGIQMREVAGFPLALGLVASNLGTRLRTAGTEQRALLPARLRLAAGWTIPWRWAEEDFDLLILVEGEDRLRALGNPSVSVGLEFGAGSADRIYLRSGAVFGSHSQTDGAAVGLGLRYERFSIDLARSVAGVGPTLSDEPLHLTIGLTF